jgi:citrate lyase subunit beta/citryl-CoA lyase
MMPVARSYLFVPGHRPERFDKACAAGADAVIIDLEDAVAPEHKDAARAAVAGWLSGRRPVLVRINGAQTRWFADDLALIGQPGLAGLVLPKAEQIDPALMRRCADAGVPVLPLIESARGFDTLNRIARTPGVQRLLFGSIDLQFDLGLQGDDDALLYFRSRLVLASRLAELPPPVDGVSTAIDEPERLRADTARARRLGFGAKLCIHPKQVETVNAGFVPSADELAWARRIVAAAAGAAGAALAVDGAMVDRPVLLRAQAIVDAAAARAPGIDPAR